MYFVCLCDETYQIFLIIKLLIVVFFFDTNTERQEGVSSVSPRLFKLVVNSLKRVVFYVYAPPVVTNQVTQGFIFTNMECRKCMPINLPGILLASWPATFCLIILNILLQNVVFAALTRNY